MIKIKLIGFPGCGKSKHLSIWRNNEKNYPSMSTINESLLNEEDLKKSPLEKQKLILQRYQLSIEEEQPNKTEWVLDHTPLEMIGWYTDYFFGKKQIPLEQYNKLKREIFLLKLKEISRFDKIVHIYFIASAKFCAENIKKRARKNENFDINCFNYVSNDKGIFEHMCRRWHHTGFNYKIDCSHEKYDEYVLDEILTELDDC